MNPLSLDFFLWKMLFEQFQKLPNIYFLFIIIVMLFPGLCLLTMGQCMQLFSCSLCFTPFWRASDWQVDAMPCVWM